MILRLLEESTVPLVVLPYPSPPPRSSSKHKEKNPIQPRLIRGNQPFLKTSSYAFLLSLIFIGLLKCLIRKGKFLF